MAAAVNIIVIEDHDDLRDITVEALCGLGYYARGIVCAEALDAALAAAPADVLVLDLSLPGEDGISLACRLRTSQPELGIIMVTARDHSDQRVIGYDNGADIYLTKPTSIEELDAAIHSLMRRLRRSSELIDCLAIDNQPTIQAKMRVLHDQLIRSEGKLPTLNELAQQSGLSERRLSEAFIEQYGSSIHTYIVAYRLEQAHTIIMNTDVPLKVLADRLGYSHVNHFSAAFSRKFGYPPGRLRKEFHSDN